MSERESRCVSKRLQCVVCNVRRGSSMKSLIRQLCITIIVEHSTLLAHRVGPNKSKQTYIHNSKWAGGGAI